MRGIEPAVHRGGRRRSPALQAKPGAWVGSAHRSIGKRAPACVLHAATVGRGLVGRPDGTGPHPTDRISYEAYGGGMDRAHRGRLRIERADGPAGERPPALSPRQMDRFIPNGVRLPERSLSRGIARERSGQHKLIVCGRAPSHRCCRRWQDLAVPPRAGPPASRTTGLPSYRSWRGNGCGAKKLGELAG